MLPDALEGSDPSTPHLLLLLYVVGMYYSAVYLVTEEKRSVAPSSQRRRIPPKRPTTREYTHRLRGTSRSLTTAVPSTSTISSPVVSFPVSHAFPREPQQRNSDTSRCHPPSQASRVGAGRQSWQAETRRRGEGGQAGIHLPLIDTTLPASHTNGRSLRLRY